MDADFCNVKLYVFLDFEAELLTWVALVSAGHALGAGVLGALYTTQWCMLTVLLLPQTPQQRHRHRLTT